MNLLFTGASGFLGQHCFPILSKAYFVKTIGLTDNDDYQINLAKEIPLLNEKFDIVLHAAGKAHSTPRTKVEKALFFEVNLQGTKNLCAGLEKSGIPQSLIFISTVAVYGLEAGENITEDFPLAGTSPYALSKIQAEQYLTDWCKANQVILTILRPSLIAGPNPPGNLGDMIQGIKSGKYLSIGGGKARKSVLMVQDIANLIPLVVEKGGIFNTCDSKHPDFHELEALICKQLDKPGVISISHFAARVIAKIGDFAGVKAPINSDKLFKITNSLTFSNEKAKQELGWEPLDVVTNFRIF
jgi:GlcNAc-P-P-Und epimerase